MQASLLAGWVLTTADALSLLNEESDMPDEADRAVEPQTFGDLPIQPTGFGVKDLEMAYDQMQLTADNTITADGASPVEGGDNLVLSTENSAEMVESAAHPS
jgi:hypothetical protein